MAESKKIDGCDSCSVLVSQGTLIQVQDEVGTFINIACVRDFNGPNISRGEIDVTTLCSTAKEYIPDLKDNGDFSVTAFYSPRNKAQRLLMNALDEVDSKRFRVVLPDDGMGNTSFEFDAFVKSFPISGAQSQAISANLGLRITGDIEWEYPDDIGANLGFSTFILEEDSANDGSVSSTIAVTLYGGTFAGTNGSALPGVTFTGEPAGLTAVCTKVSDTTAMVSFSGSATEHDSGVSATVGLTFENAAFADIAADNVTFAKDKAITINFI